MSELEFWKDLGNIFDAILNYQKKNVEFNNRFINPWIRLGNVFERQDQHNEAVQAYQHATEIDPDSAQNWIDLGDAQFKSSAYAEAAVSYQKAINLDPQSGWPLSNLALVLVTLGKYEEAIPLYTASVSLLTDDKDKAITWNRLGNAYRKLNDYENAFLAFQRADELDSENTGFSDKLDEAPPSMTVVAPEEILEQMIVEQQLQAEEVSAVNETNAVESVEPEAETKFAEEPVALAPNMEMKVEEEPAEGVAEEIAAESVAAEVAVEEVVAAPVAEGMAEETAEIAEPAVEIAVEEVTEIVPETAVTEPAAEVILEEAGEVVAVETATEESTEVVTEPVAEEIPAEPQERKSSVLQLIEDVIAKVEAAAGFGEEKAEVKEEVVEAKPSRIPSWLIINDKTMIENAIAEGEELVKAAQQENEASLADDVTTISDVPLQVAVSESAVNMDIVETFTEAMTVPANEEAAVSEEIAEEVVEQAEVKAEAVAEEVEVEEAIAQESIVAEEAAAPVEVESEVEVTEAAYEEYLKDVVEPTILSDHVDEISEAPLTKVSKDGEVRIAMDTKNAHVWNELGNVYLNAGSYDDAIASYGKALELDRNFAWPYSNLALAYVQKGRFAEAILLYQRGIELFSSDKDKAVTWNRLGNVYRRMNDYDNAIAAYQTADELDPENATLSLRSNFGLLGNIQSEQNPAYIS
jgi:tetratricopeptide (TPR) repeat protein